MTKKPSQIQKFRDAARALGADESEAAFDAALGKIAQHKPKPDTDKLAKLIESNDPTKGAEIASAIGNKDDN